MTADPRTPGAEEVHGERAFVVFTSLWSAAALFHILGNPTTGSRVAVLGVGITATAVLLRPRSTIALVALAMAQLYSVWSEAPFLPNHWLLTGIVNLGIVAVVIVKPTDAAAVRVGTLAAGRMALLAFYGFAAFSKLNTDFLDPVTSCATFFFTETTTSIGLGDPTGWFVDLTGLVPWSTTVTELAVFALLLGRRTRPLGVFVAMAFHAGIALDRTHQFYDFSSVLAPLFLAFGHPCAPPSWIPTPDSPISRWWRPVTALAGLAVTVSAATRPLPTGARNALFDIGWLVWQPLSLALVVAAALQLRVWRTAGRPTTQRTPAPRWLLVVPALAILNGIAPYAGWKTGTSWTMYSNLSTIDGGNHLIAPLRSTDGALFEIVATNDPILGFYRESRRGLPERSLLDHLHANPRSTVAVRDVRRAAPGPLLHRGDLAITPRTEVERKMRVHRAVALDGITPCQDTYGLAV